MMMNTPNSVPILPDEVEMIQVERIGSSHLATEWHLRMLGIIYMIGGCVLISASFQWFGKDGRWDVLNACVGILLGAAHIFAGSRLIRLKQWTRVFAILSSMLVMPLYPLGTILGVCALTDLIGKKAGKVFSSDYQKVICATPGVRRGASVGFWLTVLLIAGTLCAGAYYLHDF